MEKIRKVIDPLFLDALRGEYGQIKNAARNKKRKAFQEKLSKLKFFDPTCGSGNFLTESFISLRRLENEILKEILQEKIKTFTAPTLCKLSFPYPRPIKVVNFSFVVTTAKIIFHRVRRKLDRSH